MSDVDDRSVGPAAGAVPETEAAPGVADGLAALLPAPPDEHLLDGALLRALGSERAAVAEIFAERSAGFRAGLLFGRDEEHATGPVLRVDAGAAARVVTASGVRSTHASGVDPDRLESLGRPRTGDRTAPSPAGTGEDGVPAALLSPATGFLDRARHEIARAFERFPDVASVDVELEAFVRAVHVVSSEWGHGRDVRPWCRAVVTATSRTGARARRARGATTLLAAEAGSLAADLVHAAAEAATVRDRSRSPDPAPWPVVLAGPAGGVLVHEAVGHALEADAWDRGSSVFSARLGERIAGAGLSVIDDPSLAGHAGSLLIDDEGVGASPAPLVEGGVLRSILADGLRTGFLPGRSGGRGRRASFRDLPLPRMTNTHGLPGSDDPDDVVRGARDGLLVTRLERAAMDPLTGDFRFRVTEGFALEGGREGAPLAEFFLIGNAVRVLQAIEAVGSELEWDDGCSTCGREGQWLPVAVGMPALRVGGGVLGLG